MLSFCIRNLHESFQIKPEERALEQLFGAEYVDYKNNKRLDADLDMHSDTIKQLDKNHYRLVDLYHKLMCFRFHIDFLPNSLRFIIKMNKG